MGFSLQAAQMGVYESQAINLEEAVEFLANRSRTWSHPFIRKRYVAEEGARSNHCMICGEGIETHLASPQISLPPFRSQSSLPRRVTSISIPRLPHEYCPICTEAIAAVWKAKGCHEHKFCRKCAAEYVGEKVNEGQEIHCPFHDCEAVLGVEEIGDLVGTALTGKWERKQLEQNPLYRHCPALNCSGYLITMPVMEQVNCPVCRLNLCSHCGKTWHPQVPCDIISDQELHSSQDVKACPGCQRFIEKNQGCDHMTCRICLHEWCWQCLRPYTNTHFLQDSDDFCPVLRLNQQASLSPPTRIRKCSLCVFLIFWVLLSPLLLVLFGILSCCLWPWAFISTGKSSDSGCFGLCCAIFCGLLTWPMAPVCGGCLSLVFVPIAIFNPEALR